VFAEQRHGGLHEFLALTGGLSIAEVARKLRCCSRTIRNYVAGRSPIPWHRIEMLRLLALETSATQGNSSDGMSADEPPVVANIDPDPAAPDVPPADSRPALPFQQAQLRAICTPLERSRKNPTCQA